MAKKFQTLVAVLIFAALLDGAVVCQARYHIEVESAYLGDGWFRYRLHTAEDPFFLFFDLGFLQLPFPGFSEFAADPLDWSSRLLTDPVWPEPTIYWQAVDCGRLGCQTLPYERLFLARSDKRHFKRRQDAVVTISFSTVGGYHGPIVSGNWVGFITFNALFPCDPIEADNSPTNLVERFTLFNVSDPQIGSLIREGTELHGLTFDYDEPSTVRLEATRAFRAWTNVAYIYGEAGTTRWTTNRPLSNFGDFFRLRLVAEGHVLSLPPLNCSSAASLDTLRPLTLIGSPPLTANQTDAPLVSCRPRGQQLELDITGTAGVRYLVELLSKSGETLQTREIEGTGSVTRLMFDAPRSAPVIIAVRPSP